MYIYVYSHASALRYVVGCGQFQVTVQQLLLLAVQIVHMGTPWISVRINPAEHVYPLEVPLQVRRYFSRGGKPLHSSAGLTVLNQSRIGWPSKAVYLPLDFVANELIVDIPRNAAYVGHVNWLRTRSLAADHGLISA